jgi:anti-anti-sigma factor
MVDSSPATNDFSVSLDDRRDDPAHRCVVVQVTGELDVNTVGGLRVALDDLLVDGVPTIVVDLRPLAFMDSSGLGALVAAHRKARVLKCAVAVVAGGGIVTRLLETTGLVRVLRVFGSVDEALAAR